MLVEIVKPVCSRGEVLRSGLVDAPEKIAMHWIATGAARLPKATEPEPPAPAAHSGKKRF